MPKNGKISFDFRDRDTCERAENNSRKSSEKPKTQIPNGEVKKKFPKKKAKKSKKDREIVKEIDKSGNPTK